MYFDMFKELEASIQSVYNTSESYYNFLYIKEIIETLNTLLNKGFDISRFEYSPKNSLVQYYDIIAFDKLKKIIEMFYKVPHLRLYSQKKFFCKYHKKTVTFLYLYSFSVD